jgi:integrase
VIQDLVRYTPKPGQFSPHCLRHSAITFALDAGVSPRDVQDYAGHKDPGLAFASSRR